MLDAHHTKALGGAEHRVGPFVLFVAVVHLHAAHGAARQGCRRRHLLTEFFCPQVRLGADPLSTLDKRS